MLDRLSKNHEKSDDFTKNERKNMLKRVSCVVLGVFLAAAFCTPVIAETKVEFSGNYRVRANYFNNLNVAGDNGDEEKSSYFDQRLRMNLKIMPSESLVMNVSAQALDNKWGTSDYKKRYWLDQTGNSSSVEIYFAYMDVMTSFGKFSFGRMVAGLGGLATMGYNGSVLNASNVFDTETPKMRIRHTYRNGGLIVWTAYEKLVEKDFANNSAAGPGADEDSDILIFMPQYMFKNGGANICVCYVMDHTLPGFETNFWWINPAAMWNFGPIGLHAEGLIVTGDMENGGLLVGKTGSGDVEGYSFYLDATYKYGQGVAGLQYAWFQGDDDPTDATFKGMAKAGEDFNPFFLTTNIGLDHAGNLYNASNYWLLGAWVDHNISEDLLFHAAAGYFGINEPGKKKLNASEDAASDYGMEFNAGVTYQIMSNLSWELQLAYFVAGDYLKDSLGHEVGNAYGMRNVLTLKF